MNESMRRVVVSADGVEVVDAPIPVPREHELLVETVVSGVCGSDTHAAAGHHPFIALPYLPGHEVVGRVREAGAGVRGIAAGDLVTVEPTLPCLDCKMCRIDRSNICERLRFFGCGYEQGGMSECFTIPASRVHVVPAGLSPLQAALIEPLATPVHAERLSGGVEGKAVVILGAGTIGLLMLATVRHAGARRVVVTDLVHSKRERARRLGADAVIDAGSPAAVEEAREALGESADVVFDCVAVQSTLDQAVSMAGKGGTVAVVGVPSRPVTVALPEIQDLQLRIQGSATYLPEDFATAIEIIAAGHARPEDLVTATFPLERAAEAFAASIRPDHVKVLVAGGAT